MCRAELCSLSTGAPQSVSSNCVPERLGQQGDNMCSRLGRVDVRLCYCGVKVCWVCFVDEMRKS